MDTMEKGVQYVSTQFGDKVSFDVVDHHKLCKEFILSYRRFSFKRWCFWTVFFNTLGYCFKLHMQDSRIMMVMLCVVILALVIKVNIKVHKESLLVSASVGVQLTTTFLSGRKISKFYDMTQVKDILINEGITMHQVLFYLTLLLKEEHDSKISKLVPLFTHCWPSIDCLKWIYQGTQGLIHTRHLHSS